MHEKLIVTDVSYGINYEFQPNFSISMQQMEDDFKNIKRHSLEINIGTILEVSDTIGQHMMTGSCR